MFTVRIRRFVPGHLGALLLLGIGLALCLNSAALAQDLRGSAEDAASGSEVAPGSTGDTRPIQVIYLDFDGASGVVFDGPVLIADITVPTFHAGQADMVDPFGKVETPGDRGAGQDQCRTVGIGAGQRRGDGA